jgi:hypothetical protein
MLNSPPCGCGGMLSLEKISRETNYKLINLKIFFFSVLLAETAYTQQQPTSKTKQRILLSAPGFGC